MRYDIIFAPQAVRDLKRLPVRDRTIIRDAVEKHLRFEPDKVSQSRIKRLQGIRHPQYRLRVGEIRVFYDIVADEVKVLAIVQKSDAADWLAEMGEAE
jgi:mRNA-degrading endonuclease RelE of RelBE toxin-antitoxin system